MGPATGTHTTASRTGSLPIMQSALAVGAAATTAIPAVMRSRATSAAFIRAALGSPRVDGCGTRLRHRMDRARIAASDALMRARGGGFPMRPLVAISVLLLLPFLAPASAHDAWAAGYFVGASTNATAPLIHVVLRVGSLTPDAYHEGQIEIYPIASPSTTIHPVRVFFENLTGGGEGGPLLDVNDEDGPIELLGLQTTNDHLAPITLKGFLAELGIVELEGF